MAQGHPCQPGDDVRGASHGRHRRGKAEIVRRRRGGDRHRQDGRRRRHQGTRDRIRPRHRHPRRHGRAADPRDDRPLLRLEDTRQDARLRPRRPYRHAAGCREIPGRDAQLRRRRCPHLPAGGGGRRRRAGHGRGRHDGPFRHPGGLRPPQSPGHAARHLHHPRRADDGGNRRLLDRGGRIWRPCCLSAQDGRRDDGGGPDHGHVADRRGAQRRSARLRGSLRHQARARARPSTSFRKSRISPAPCAPSRKRRAT